MKRTYENYVVEYELCPCGYSEATKNLHFSQSQLDLFLDKYFEPLKLENQQLKSEQNKVAVEKLEEVSKYVEEELNSFSWDGDRTRYYTLIDIKHLIEELKGESNE